MKNNKGTSTGLILLGMLTLFAGFIYLLSRPSKLAMAQEELAAARQMEEVETIYRKYAPDFTEGSGEQPLLDKDFEQAFKTKLKSFRPGPAEIAAIQKWFPIPRYLNVIIIPDLSRRMLIFTDQYGFDTAIIHAAYRSFKERTKTGFNTQHRFKIDVTNKSQSRYWPELGDRLFLNLAGHQNKNNRQYFTREVEEQFRADVDKLYAPVISMNMQSPEARFIGANYVHYINYELPASLPSSTLDAVWQHKVIILSDGELAALPNTVSTQNINYTSLEDRGQLAALAGNPAAFDAWLAEQKRQIPVTVPPVTPVEYLLLEVRDKTGDPEIESIYLAYWRNWFARLNAPDPYLVYRHNNTSRNAMETVDNFIAR